MVDKQFDTFLSHNSDDKETVRKIANYLKREGISAWIDDELAPGTQWQEAIERTLPTCSSCCVFIGPSGIGPWQNEEMRAAINHRIEQQGDFRVIPVLLPGTERPERSSLPMFLSSATWVEFRNTVEDKTQLERLRRGILPHETNRSHTIVDTGIAPYRGLEPFGEEHQQFFFGREALVEWLVDDLRQCVRSSSENRVLAIVGPSGSGKSSLVRAGLVTALKNEAIDASDKWHRLHIRPGRDPIESLAIALHSHPQLCSKLPEIGKLIESLRSSNRTLHLMLGVAMHETPRDHRVVLFVDQFEELFTLCSDFRTRLSFIRNLINASSVGGSRAFVILIVRADMYGQCAAFPDLAAAVSDHHHLVAPLQERELRRAISAPAESLDCEFEPGLVDLLCRDVREQTGALPLLQHTLRELWDRRETNVLTVDSYRSLGGIEGALNHYADTIFAEMDAQQQKLCKRILLRLVVIGDRRADSKQLVPVSQLRFAAQSEIEAVLQLLVDARLVISDRNDDIKSGSVELAHEALLSAWTTYRDWIDEERESIKARQQLTEAAEEWAQHDASQSMVFVGRRLEAAERWAHDNPLEVAVLEQDFLDASRQNRDQMEKDEAARLARDKEFQLRLDEKDKLIKKKDELIKKKDQLIRQKNEKGALLAKKKPALVTFAVCAICIVGILYVWARYDTAAVRRESAAVKERLIATEKAMNSSESEKVAMSETLTKNEKEIQDLRKERDLAIQQRTKTESTASKARDDVRSIRSKLSTSQVLLAHQCFTNGEMRRVQQLLVEAKPTLDTWEYMYLRGQMRKYRELRGHTHSVTCLAFAPGGEEIISGSRDKTLRTWRVLDQIQTRLFRGHSELVTAVSYSPNGKIVASGSTDNRIIIWDADSGEQVRVMRVRADVYGLAFDPTGDILASSSADTLITLWNVDDGTKVAELRGHSWPALGLQFNHDGSKLITTSGDGKLGDKEQNGELFLWSVAEKSKIRSFDGHSGSVYGASCSANGNWIVSCSSDRTVRKWDVETGNEMLRIATVDTPIFGVALAQDEQVIMGASRSGRVFCWDVETGNVVATFPGHAGSAYCIGCSDQLVASGGVDRVVRFWDLAETDTECPVNNITGRARSLQFNADGTQLVVATVNGISVFSHTDGHAVLEFGVQSEGLQCAALEISGSRLATGSVDGKVRVWNMDSASIDSEVGRHLGPVRAVAWNKDATRLISGGDDETIRIWSVDGSMQEQVLRGHAGTINALAISANGVSLVSGGADRKVRIWNLATGAVLKTLSGHSREITSVAIDPNVKVLASSSIDGVTIVWNVENGTRLHTLSRHTGAVRDLTFGKNGERLFTCGADDRIKVWNVAEARQVLELKGSGTEWYRLAMSPDGQTLCAIGSWNCGDDSNDSAIKLWSGGT